MTIEFPRSVTRVYKLVVRLTPADLYSLTAYNAACKIVDETDGIYCDQLREVVAHMTGLALSL